MPGSWRMSNCKKEYVSNIIWYKGHKRLRCVCCSRFVEPCKLTRIKIKRRSDFKEAIFNVFLESSLKLNQKISYYCWSFRSKSKESVFFLFLLNNLVTRQIMSLNRIYWRAGGVGGDKMIYNDMNGNTWCSTLHKDIQKGKIWS